MSLYIRIWRCAKLRRAPAPGLGTQMSPYVIRTVWTSRIIFSGRLDAHSNHRQRLGAVRFHTHAVNNSSDLSGAIN